MFRHLKTSPDSPRVTTELIAVSKRFDRLEGRVARLERHLPPESFVGIGDALASALASYGKAIAKDAAEKEPETV